MSDSSPLSRSQVPAWECRSGLRSQAPAWERGKKLLSVQSARIIHTFILLFMRKIGPASAGFIF